MDREQTEQDLVDKWNAKYPEGTRVTVRRDSGELKHTTTRSEAWVLSGHSAVIMVEGIPGCYDLRRLLPEIAE